MAAIVRVTLPTLALMTWYDTPPGPTTVPL